MGKNIVKIQVQVLLLDGGPVLYHSKTKKIFKYTVPHDLIGLIDITTSKITYKVEEKIEPGILFAQGLSCC